MNLDTMTKREMDAAIERLVFNRATEKIGELWWVVAPANTLPGSPYIMSDVRDAHPVHDYHSDHKAAYEMEEELKRQGLEKHYAWCLGQIVFDGMETHKMGTYHKWWLLIHATPLQRTKAALRVIMKEKP